MKLLKNGLEVLEKKLKMLNIKDQTQDIMTPTEKGHLND